MTANQIAYWKMREESRHNVVTEEVSKRQVGTMETQAAASLTQAAAASVNAQVNLRNAETNARNAAVNERNAETNARNAASNAVSAEANRRQAEVAAGRLANDTLLAGYQAGLLMQQTTTEIERANLTRQQAGLVSEQSVTERAKLGETIARTALTEAQTGTEQRRQTLVSNQAYEAQARGDLAVEQQVTEKYRRLENLTKAYSQLVGLGTEAGKLIVGTFKK